jgi:hypothetical protein
VRWTLEMIGLVELASAWKKRAEKAEREVGRLLIQADEMAAEIESLKTIEWTLEHDLRAVRRGLGTREAGPGFSGAIRACAPEVQDIAPSLVPSPSNPQEVKRDS